MKRILSVFLIFANPLFAQTQSLEALTNKVESYMLNQLATYTEGKVSVSAGKLDPRLTLQACPEDKLEIFNPYDTPPLNTSTIGLKCTEETKHWTLYIPVKVTVLKSVLVAKRPLTHGRIITEADVYSAEMDIQRLKQGYFTQPKEIIGLVCKKDIAVDFPFNAYSVELAKLVHRGEEIAIMAINNNLKISMDGIAMGDGAIGDTIRVKNISSKKIVEAQVIGVKKVKVAM